MANKRAASGGVWHAAGSKNSGKIAARQRFEITRVWLPTDGGPGLKLGALGFALLAFLQQKLLFPL
jgi:hypothetical protein